jgi:hypothetical protein
VKKEVEELKKPFTLYVNNRAKKESRKLNIKKKYTKEEKLNKKNCSSIMCAVVVYEQPESYVHQ